MLTKFLPLVSQLGAYLKIGIDYYAELRLAGQLAGPDAVAAHIQEHMASWDPKVGETSLLDDDTRAAAARFLAGVAINLTSGT